MENILFTDVLMTICVVLCQNFTLNHVVIVLGTDMDQDFLRNELSFTSVIDLENNFSCVN